MNRKKMTPILVSTAVFLLATWYWQQQAAPETVAETAEPELEGAAVQKTAKKESPLPSIQSLAAKTMDDPKIEVPEPVASEDGLMAALDSTDFYQSIEMTRLVERMRRSDPKLMADALLKGLQDAGDQDTSQRNRIMLVAEAWRSDELLPLWLNMAFRDTPRSPNESEAIHSLEPTEESVGIRLEIMTAIANLGMLASRNDEALASLKKIILTPDPKIHSTFVRERAYYALREADLNASLQILRGLKDSDELRSYLIRN